MDAVAEIGERLHTIMKVLPSLGSTNKALLLMDINRGGMLLICLGFWIKHLQHLRLAGTFFLFIMKFEGN